MMTLLSTRAPQIAKAMARPSVALVPRPSSSTRTRLCLDTFCKINAISLISEENVLALISMPSSTEIRVNKFSRSGKEAYSAGTLELVSHDEGRVQ
jgi:hypothetical protein